MSTRKRFLAEIEQKRQENADLQARIDSNNQEISVWEKALSLLPKETSPAKKPTSIRFRPGSDIEKASIVLRKAGEALYIDKILEEIGKEPTKENQVSLISSLAAYVREGRVFTRPAPNTYGLLEFEGDEDMS
tara:strand:- start:3507 stop:3905 length:399 start_codon:yes stop_codon:yes gene_type:complete